MDSVRRRATFRFSEEGEEEEDIILDEQGEDLSSKRSSQYLSLTSQKNRTKSSNSFGSRAKGWIKKGSLALGYSFYSLPYCTLHHTLHSRVLIKASTFYRQFIQLLAPTTSNPVLIIFPAELPSSRSVIPFATGFTLLALFIHLNLAILFHPDDVRTCLQLTHNPQPLSYGMLYALSAVAPTLSLFLYSPWKTTLWWLLTTVVIFAVQCAMNTIESSSRGISELESKRYVFRGAWYSLMRFWVDPKTSVDKLWYPFVSIIREIYGFQ